MHHASPSIGPGATRLTNDSRVTHVYLIETDIELVCVGGVFRRGRRILRRARLGSVVRRRGRVLRRAGHGRRRLCRRDLGRGGHVLRRRWVFRAPHLGRWLVQWHRVVGIARPLAFFCFQLPALAHAEPIGSPCFVRYLAPVMGIRVIKQRCGHHCLDEAIVSAHVARWLVRPNVDFAPIAVLSGRRHCPKAVRQRRGRARAFPLARHAQEPVAHEVVLVLLGIEQVIDQDVFSIRGQCLGRRAADLERSVSGAGAEGEKWTL